MLAKNKPLRIVSLVPSITELLHYLQLENEVIGITKFCILPSGWYKSKVKIGGTKTVNISAIKKLQPNLIIANKEENVKEQIEELSKDYNVLLTDVSNIKDALKMIAQIGKIVGKEKRATSLVNNLKNQFSKFPITKPKKAAYLIWKNPYMTVGGDTYISNVLKKCGFKNVFEHLTRYPITTVEDIAKSNCEVLFLSSEPFPFKQKHVTELEKHLPQTKIILVDGALFSWYGSRMLLMGNYLPKLNRLVSPKNKT